MVDIIGASKVFLGDRPELIILIPPIAAGYLFTITGSLYYFILASSSLAGARRLIEIAQLLEDDSVDQITDGYRSLGYIQRAILFLVVMAYGISVLAAIYGLYRNFTHTDPILVALSGSLIGILLILVTTPSVPDSSAEN